MGYHIDDQGRFQSDKYPKLPPDKIVVSFKDEMAWAALETLADCYDDIDQDLADDIRTRLRSMAATFAATGSLKEATPK